MGERRIKYFREADIRLGLYVLYPGQRSLYAASNASRRQSYSRRNSTCRDGATCCRFHAHHSPHADAHTDLNPNFYNSAIRLPDRDFYAHPHIHHPAR